MWEGRHTLENPAQCGLRTPNLESKAFLSKVLSSRERKAPETFQQQFRERASHTPSTSCHPISQVVRVPEESSREGLCSRQMVSTQTLVPIRRGTQESGTKALSLSGSRGRRLRDTSGACPTLVPPERQTLGIPQARHIYPQTHRLLQASKSQLRPGLTTQAGQGYSCYSLGYSPCPQHVCVQRERVGAETCLGFHTRHPWSS